MAARVGGEPLEQRVRGHVQQELREVRVEQHVEPVEHLRELGHVGALELPRALVRVRVRLGLGLGLGLGFRARVRVRV